MKIRILFLFIIAISFVHLTGNLTYGIPADRNILFSQIPDTLTATGCACQLDSTLDMEADLADDVMPGGSGWQIDSVVAWFNNWGYFHTWDSVPNIHFIIYSDSNGMPADSPMTEIVIGQADYVDYMISYPDRWRIEFGLTPPVILDTFRYWIEIQPSNRFEHNGYTGNMSAIGIGNGQDFFFRYPQAGVPRWNSAYLVFGEHYESGFMLIGTQLGMSEHKVAEAGPDLFEVSPTIGCNSWTIALRLLSPRRVRINLYDAAGLKIRSIIDCRAMRGSSSIPLSLDGLPGGIYFVSAETENNSAVRKITKIR